MGLFSSTKAKLAASKLVEEQLYEAAANEVASGQIRQGIWAQAIAQSDGNEAAAKARYLKLRVEIMKAEAEVMMYAEKEAVKEAQKASQNEHPPYVPDPNLSPIDQAKGFLRHEGFTVTGGPDNYRIVDKHGMPAWVTAEQLCSKARAEGLGAVHSLAP